MIFLFGTQKSGTTWLRNIISQFMEVSANYEWQIPKLVESVYGHVAFCGVSRRRIEKRDKSVSASATTIRELMNGEVIGCVCDKSAYPSLAASSRNDELYPYHISLSRLTFPNSINILIVRDPRDVLASSKHYFRLDDMDVNEISAFGNSWSRCNLQWISDNPDHVLRYEDLKIDFGGTVERLLKAANIEYNDETLANMTLNFRDMDYSKSRDPFFYRSGKIGSWKTDLTEIEAATVEKYSSFAMKVFGYE